MSAAVRFSHLTVRALGSPDLPQAHSAQGVGGFSSLTMCQILFGNSHRTLQQVQLLLSKSAATLWKAIQGPYFTADGFAFMASKRSCGLQWFFPIRGKRWHFKGFGGRGMRRTKDLLKRFHLFERRQARRGTNPQSCVDRDWGTEGSPSHLVQVPHSTSGVAGLKGGACAWGQPSHKQDDSVSLCLSLGSGKTSRLIE